MSIRTGKLIGASGYAYVATRNTATTLKGSALDDMLVGAGGNDLLEGGLGADQLNGGDGIDTATYINSASWVSIDLLRQSQMGGDAQGDRLVSIENVTGSRFNDTLNGDAANNVFEGGAGADHIDGRGGSDSASYATSDAAVMIDLRVGLQRGGHAERDWLQNIENVIGSRFNDSLIGDQQVNDLFGGAGDDVLEGLGGADVINGGDGIDTASYSQARSAVTVDLRASVQSGFGDAAGDRLISIENLTGSAFDDTLIGTSLANVLSGGNGNDTLEGLGGADTLNGGQGSDTANYANSGAAVFIDLRAVTQSGGDAAGDRLTEIENAVGSRFNDTLTGDGLDNVLSGGAGNDLLQGHAGADTLIGGDGIDTATYVNSMLAVTVDLMAVSQSRGDAAGDRLSGIENVTGTRFNDRLSGDAMSNELNGGAGDDVIEGGGGADKIIGGDGFDIASYSRSATGVTVSLATNTGTLGDARGDTLFGIEGLIGSHANDVLTGNTASNWFDGGLGADTIDGGTGIDTVSYAGSSAISLNLASWVNKGGAAEGDVLRSIEIVIGSEGDDVMIAGNAIEFRGGAGADRLTGGSGVDRLFGDAGDDMIEGGAGADVLDGGAGIDDWVSYTGSNQGVIVELNGMFQYGGHAANDRLTNFEHILGSAYDDRLIGDSGSNVLSGASGNDELQGNGGDDVLQGGSGDDALFGQEGNDTLSGGDGNDYLLGGSGNDTLFGGAGSDRFDARPVTGHDRIMDFNVRQDVVKMFAKGWAVSHSDKGTLISYEKYDTSLLLVGVDQTQFQSVKLDTSYIDFLDWLQ